MPKVTKDEARALLADEKATGIKDFPDAHPNQRGPSCGFSALAYAFDCLYFSGEYGLKKPLPARTQSTIAGAIAQTPAQRAAKAELAERRAEFVSLRQLAKFNSLTVLGSVFSAEDLATVARKAQPGSYEAQVVSAGDATDFEQQIEMWLGRRCPVIVPFDVDTSNGEPINQTGKAAHWVTVLASFNDAGVRQLLYYNWGRFFHARLQAFATSNSQLASNEEVVFEKYEIYRDQAAFTAQTPERRDWMTAQSIAAHQTKNPKSVVKKLPNEPKTNPEFNDPKADSASAAQARPRAANGGLRAKFVVVYPAAAAVAAVSAAAGASPAAAAAATAPQ